MNERRTGNRLCRSVSGSRGTYYNAVKYASERIRAAPTQSQSGTSPNHQTRRYPPAMLMYQKAHIGPSRTAMSIYTYYLIDLAENSSDAELVKSQRLYRGPYPVVKAYCSDVCWLSLSEAMQVYRQVWFSRRRISYSPAAAGHPYTPFGKDDISVHGHGRASNGC